MKKGIYDTLFISGDRFLGSRFQRFPFRLHSLNTFAMFFPGIFSFLVHCISFVMIVTAHCMNDKNRISDRSIYTFDFPAAYRRWLAKGCCETNSSFPFVLVLVLEIPSVKTARTDSIAFCDSFSQGDPSTSYVPQRAAGVIAKDSSLRARRFPFPRQY